MGRLSSFFAKFSRSSATPEELADFRTVLIESDLGSELSEEVLELARRTKGEELIAAIQRHLKESLVEKDRTLSLIEGGVTTILIVGVNGTGKTTTTAKLAQRYHDQGMKVIIAAADTFRAAAVEQLQTWGERIGVEVVTGKSNSDPASVAFEAARIAIEKSANILIVDTAGRLHNKSNLMAELTKIEKVISKLVPISECLFVLDGTTGQNGIAQARTFGEAVNLTGIVVTKLDGSTKGGIAIAVERSLGIPVKLIGVGEGAGDLRDFDPDTYIADLLTNS